MSKLPKGTHAKNQTDKAKPEYEHSLSLLPLKSDVVFKLVFGDARYIDIIRAFLVAALDIPEEEYDNLKIIDPHLERDSPDDKLGILDVRVQLKNKKIISVEIQVKEIPFMAERVAFSTGRNLSRQISPGQKYSQIAKVITIVITNYDIIDSDDYYHHKFWLYDPEKKVGLTNIMEIHTLEMKKLPESTSDNSKENELIDWLRLIRSERREEIEMLATKTPEMEMAVGRLKQLSADEKTRMLYESRELYIMDEMARMEGAEARGEARGRTSGRAEGEAIGIAKGEREKALAMAKGLLAKNISLDIIAEVSGLSLDELWELEKKA
ncbi:hypothetical protein AGMMS50276_30820 [Synergistales bacterium]|nr:hypothetical protein AGMMS50276_30820 [Synergistales bacterium]